jgi:hypothetical protein
MDKTDTISCIMNFLFTGHEQIISSIYANVRLEKEFGRLIL